MADDHPPLPSPWKTGMAGRCPRCGEGKLFSSYLKVAPRCSACGLEFSGHEADDAPPYFTILLVGHLVVGPMLLLPFIWTWPVQYVLLAILPLLAVMTLLLLPRVKGAVIGLQWAIKRSGGKAPGQDEDKSWTTTS